MPKGVFAQRYRAELTCGHYLKFNKAPLKNAFYFCASCGKHYHIIGDFERLAEPTSWKTHRKGGSS